MLDSTKQNVVNSLLTLLEEKPMDDITISELTQLAGISRMTFYRNYSCKEDILSEHFKDVLAQYKRTWAKNTVREIITIKRT